MSIFKLKIYTHGGHFGETTTAEQGVIAQVLASVAQTVGRGHPLVGDQPITLQGDVIGAFSFGKKSHSETHRKRREREAEGLAHD